MTPEKGGRNNAHNDELIDQVVAATAAERVWTSSFL